MAKSGVDVDRYHGWPYGNTARCMVDDSCMEVPVPNEGARKLLDAREKTHGDHGEVSRIADGLRSVMESSQNWRKLSPNQRDVLHMKATKIARILSGDHNFIDHWVDDAGYSELIVRGLR